MGVVVIAWDEFLAWNFSDKAQFISENLCEVKRRVQLPSIRLSTMAKLVDAIFKLPHLKFTALILISPSSSLQNVCLAGAKLGHFTSKIWIYTEISSIASFENSLKMRGRELSNLIKKYRTQSEDFTGRRWQVPIADRLGLFFLSVHPEKLKSC